MTDTVKELTALMLVAQALNPVTARVIVFVQARPGLGWPELQLLKELW